MPNVVVPGESVQIEGSEQDSSWSDFSVERSAPTAEASPDRLTIERETFSVTIGDVFESLSNQNWRRAAKEIFHLIGGTEQAVRGLGFKINGLEDLSQEQRDALFLAAERRDQSALDWPEKLECAAFRTAAQLPAAGAEQDRNADIVRHLKENSQTGDIIFVSSEGAGEPLIAEVFQATFRRFSARSEMDYQFPFYHVLVNIGDGKLLHMTFRGVHETTWEKLLLKSSAYDAVAVARLEAPKEVREELAEEAIAFARERHFNYLWAVLEGPMVLSERQRGESIPDTSATDTRSICLDFATEAARALRARGAELDPEIESSVTPLDLFSASSLKIVQASALKRVA